MEQAKTSLSERLYISVLFWIIAGLTLLTLIHPVGILASDNFDGFLALKGWLNGGPFNHVHYVNAEDLTKESYGFQVWYSPGQYMMPYAVQVLAGISFISSLQVFSVIELFVLITGCYKLFKTYGYERKVILVSLIVILLTRTVLINYSFYGGGDYLLLAFFPWLILGFRAISRQKNILLKVTSIILLVLFGVFLKLTFMVIILGLLLSMVTFTSFKGVTPWFKDFFKSSKYVLVVGTLAAFVLIQVFYLSKGSSPNTYRGFSLNLTDSVELFCSPLAIFNFDYVTTFITTKSTLAGIIVYSLKLGVCAFILYWVHKKENPEYRRLIFGVYTFFIVYYLYAFNFATVYGGSRHLIYVSLLLVPFMVKYGLFNKNLTLKMGAFAMFCVSVFYAGYSFQKTRLPAILTPMVGIKGFDYQNTTGPALNRQMLDKLKRIDQKEPDALIVTNVLHVRFDMNNCLQVPAQKHFDYQVLKKQKKDVYFVYNKANVERPVDNQKLRDCGLVDILIEDDKYLMAKYSASHINMP